MNQESESYRQDLYMKIGAIKDNILFSVLICNWIKKDERKDKGRR
jgi:hypothetical protein